MMTEGGARGGTLAIWPVHGNSLFGAVIVASIITPLTTAPRPPRPQCGRARSAFVAILIGLAVTSGAAHAAPSGQNLSGQNLSGQNFAGANLQSADFRNAVLSGVNMKGADLRGANFSGASMNKADLRGANMQGADLRRTNMSGSNM